MIIEVQNLSKDYGQLKAVDGISFEVEKGEIFGFLGPNGAGKSTTISMLCTILKPSSGKATLNGFDVVDEQDSVRRSIGIVFQDPSLDERLTALENLQFHAMIYGVPRGERMERIDRVLEMVELNERKKEIVRTFSGGMKRRLEIARGLLHYPKVLFLDEPTIGLDPQTRNHIWNYIHQLRDEYQITIFLTTHYMDEAENCGRIGIIDYGKIVAMDTPANLKQQIGGDIINISCQDNVGAAAELKSLYGIDATAADNDVRFEVASGETFIPKLIAEFPMKIDSIGLRHPTLDDVFLKKTGRAMRDEQVTAKQMFLTQMRRR